MHLTWVGAVTLFLCGWSLALEIRVNLDTAPVVNGRLNLTIPRVSNVVFESSGHTLDLVNSPTCNKLTGNTINCTLMQNSIIQVWKLDIRRSMDDNFFRINVYAKVNENYEFGCSTYQFPVKLNLTEGTGRLTCEPVFVNPSINTSYVMWYRSSDPSGMDATPLNYSRVNVENSEGVVNATVVFAFADVSDAAYYFPVTEIVSNFSRFAPILVTYQPIITSDIYFRREFSEDLYIDPNFPYNWTFVCDVQSFPAATTIWRYNRTDIVGASNVTLPCNTTECPLSATIESNQQPISNSSSLRYTLTLMNVTFADYGVYTCFPENPAFLAEITDLPTSSNGHSFRIRIKDHLRPLWPAVGVIGIFIIVTVLILIGALYDHFLKGSKNDKYSSDSSQQPLSVTSTSSGSPDVVESKLTDGHLHLRRISSARAQLLEETGSN